MTTVAEGTHDVHGAPLGDEELSAAKKSLGWPDEMFHVPAEVVAYAEQRRGEWKEGRAKWNSMYEAYAKAHKAFASS